MGKFNSCGGVALISSDARLRNRAAALLDRLGIDVLNFFSIAEYTHSTIPKHAVVIIENYLSTAALDKLRTIRECESLVLVSQTNEINIITTALYNGAHFYFDITESDSLLTARLQAALRTQGKHLSTNIVVPPYNFDVRRRQVYFHSRPVELTPLEYDFAEYVFSRPEEVIADSELMRNVWSVSGLITTRRVDTAASRVRKKLQLGLTPSSWELRRIRNVGFKLRAST